MADQDLDAYLAANSLTHEQWEAMVEKELAKMNRRLLNATPIPDDTASDVALSD